jgi:hypothetical protein
MRAGWVPERKIRWIAVCQYATLSEGVVTTRRRKSRRSNPGLFAIALSVLLSTLQTSCGPSDSEIRAEKERQIKAAQAAQREQERLDSERQEKEEEAKHEAEFKARSKRFFSQPQDIWRAAWALAALLQNYGKTGPYLSGDLDSIYLDPTMMEPCKLDFSYYPPVEYLDPVPTEYNIDLRSVDSATAHSGGLFLQGTNDMARVWKYNPYDHRKHLEQTYILSVAMTNSEAAQEAANALTKIIQYCRSPGSVR